MVQRAFAAAFVVLVSQAPAVKPPNVDFSGSWTLAAGARTGVLGESFKASQTPTTLTLDLGERVETYALGGEARKTFPPPSDDVTRDPETRLWTYAKTSVSVSGWAGNQLVIVTHQFNRANVPGANPREFDAEWTSQLTLEMDADGHLVVQRESINDPLPRLPISLDRIEAITALPKESVYVKSERTP